MEGTLNKHRLSTLALGHRHAMGIDGVPFDRDVAYCESLDFLSDPYEPHTS